MYRLNLYIASIPVIHVFDIVKKVPICFHLFVFHCCPLM